jgi:SAM-dependent methyltransferase
VDVSKPSSIDRRDGASETRFEFGRNWNAFLGSVNEQRIESSIASIKSMLGRERLDGLTFLDVGCGSGLSSLAARRLGCSVLSFDFDLDSVACTEELRRRFATDDPLWSIERGSALDEEYLRQLGTFDIVYSWGVLHHTGDMNRAIAMVSKQVASGGALFLAIYHDQGSASRRWSLIKRTYHRLPSGLRPVWVAMIAGCYEFKFALARLMRGNNPLPFEDWHKKADDRGMSAWYDWVDWVGGWPFEVASPDQIINPLCRSGFSLTQIKTVGNGWGCNEYVFRKES